MDWNFSYSFCVCVCLQKKNKKKNERKRVKWQRCQLSCMPEYDPFVCDSLWKKHLAKLKQFFRPFFVCASFCCFILDSRKKSAVATVLLLRNPNPTIFILNKNQEKQQQKKGSCIIMWRNWNVKNMYLFDEMKGEKEKKSLENKNCIIIVQWGFLLLFRTDSEIPYRIMTKDENGSWTKKKDVKNKSWSKKSKIKSNKEKRILDICNSNFKVYILDNEIN